jgi:hypothetical protein
MCIELRFSFSRERREKRQLLGWQCRMKIRVMINTRAVKLMHIADDAATIMDLKRPLAIQTRHRDKITNEYSFPHLMSSMDADIALTKKKKSQN